MVYVVKSADTDTVRRFVEAVNEYLGNDLVPVFQGLKTSSDSSPIKRVAFDCEGVNLSRIGSLELISICFSNMDVYLVEFGGKTCPDIVKSVKDLFESDSVVKIIHDCRMDCDALFHLHGIKVINVHDTSCFHHIITGMENKNLNDTLNFNGISENSERDKSVYKVNPKFWATRPLTSQMIKWASSDVDKLFTLQDKQLDGIAQARKSDAVSRSEDYARTTRGMKVVTGLTVNSPGLFIGRGGQNIRDLSNRTATHIYQNCAEKTWFVFYHDDAALQAVRREMAR